MYKLIRLTWIAAALALSACEVQVNDTTPAQYQANNDIGMYGISATASQGALVSPGSLVLFAIGENQKVPLSLNADGSGWHGLYSVRCQSSFPLQLLAVWRVQGMATKNAVVPHRAAAHQAGGLRHCAQAGREQGARRQGQGQGQGRQG
jgi:hypothetical protein